MAQAKLFKKKRSGGEMNRGVSTAPDGNKEHTQVSRRAVWLRTFRSSPQRALYVEERGRGSVVLWGTFPSRIQGDFF